MLKISIKVEGHLETFSDTPECNFISCVRELLKGVLKTKEQAGNKVGAKCR